MISNISIVHFKSNVGYQLNRDQDKLFERYNLLAEKEASDLQRKKNGALTGQFSEILDKKIKNLKI